MHLPTQTGVVLSLLTLSGAAFGHVARPAAQSGLGAIHTDSGDSLREERVRDSWMLSIEGTAQVPIDFGVRVGVETPFRLRAFVGYGWVPSAYFEMFSGLADPSIGDPRADAILDRADFSGHIWRAGVGVRPFPRLGLYLDTGYARSLLDASLDVDETNIPELQRLTGGYEMSSRLDLWFVEIGYQLQFADRVVLAIGVGGMGTFDSRSSLVAVDGAPSDPALSRAAAEVDDVFQTYGFVPTLSLRLGLDLI